MLGSDTTRCGNKVAVRACGGDAGARCTAAVWAEIKKLWVVVRKATERNGNLSVELAALRNE